MAIRYEPLDLAQKRVTLTGQDLQKRPFNAGLGLLDPSGAQKPYLAESLPPLNTNGWRVFPDGTMETTHRLRSGLTWHDGHALTAEDFVFAWQVYAAPGLGIFSSKPQDQMAEALAPDPRTLVIRWRSPYPDAAALVESKDGNLEPLPRHMLELAFQQLQADPTTREAFVNHPYWTTGYVGAGPYRLGAWESGVSIEGLAFDGHALGRPKIDRFIMRIVPDENTALTNLLAGGIDFATRFTLRFEHLKVLRREWAGTNTGVILQSGGNARVLYPQLRPEYLKAPALMDLRLRKALAHSIDKEAVRDGVFDGEGGIAETFVPQDQPYYSEVDRAIVKYPFDPRRSEQLMQEAGFTKDRESFFVGPTGERVQADFRVIAGTEFERAQAIMTDAWRGAGFDVQPSVAGVAEQRDLRAQSTFSGMFLQGGGDLRTVITAFTTEQITSPATNWVGRNQNSWSSPEYDRFWAAYNSRLDRAERIQQVVGMARLVSEDVPAFFPYISISGVAHLAGLRGPQLEPSPTTFFHNMHEWENF